MNDFLAYQMQQLPHEDGCHDADSRRLSVDCYFYQILLIEGGREGERKGGRDGGREGGIKLAGWRVVWLEISLGENRNLREG